MKLDNLGANLWPFKYSNPLMLSAHVLEFGIKKKMWHHNNIYKFQLKLQEIDVKFGTNL